MATAVQERGVRERWTPQRSLISLLSLVALLGAVALAHVEAQAVAARPFLWLDSSLRPTHDADEALSLLQSAGREGLEPRDYDVVWLAEAAVRLRTAAPPPTDAAAVFERRLPLALARYLHDLHVGRVDPRRLGFRVEARVDEHDYNALATAAARTHRVAATATELVPPLGLYRDLRDRLASYRALASDDALLGALPAASSPVKPGMRYAQAALARRLVALGDAEPAAVGTTTSDVYDGALVDAVRRFQARHGLAPDGVLGPATLRALNVPLERRIEQIVLSLERLRWLPHLADGPLIGVNIPMFQVWAWDQPTTNPQPTLSMQVIVGRALETETPVFIDAVEQVVFRPYWNVPASIVRQELLPQLRRDPEALSPQQMELVEGAGDAAPVVPWSADAVSQLEQGALRVRQRPGATNALGLLKFVFPNADDVYMHGTPAPALFGRARRDLSHGCIRLEDPVGMAEWLLGRQGWTRAQVLSAMEDGPNRAIALRRSVPVVLFYMTAVVMPGSGTIRFADDIYRHDATLRRALAVRARAALR